MTRRAIFLLAYLCGVIPFIARAEYTVTPGTHRINVDIASSMVSADLNNDGRMDVISAGRTLNGGIFIRGFQNTGNYQFEEKELFTTTLSGAYANAHPLPVQLCDFNGDGLIDLVPAVNVWDYPPQLPHVLRNDGNFSFTPIAQVFYPDPRGSYGFAGVSPKQVICNDINGDGKLEVLVLGAFQDTTGRYPQAYGKGGFAFFTQTGPFSFQQISYLFPNPDSMGQAMLLAPLRTGGAKEMMIRGVLGASSRVIRVRYDGRLIQEQAILGLEGDHLVTTADFNGDGNTDVIGFSGAIYLGDGNGSFTRSPSLRVAPFNPGAHSVVSDFSNDGGPDVIDLRDQKIQLLENQGGGVFQSRPAGIQHNVTAFAVADYNGDGVKDLFLATSVTPPYLNPVQVYRGVMRFALRGATTHNGAPLSGVDIQITGPSSTKLVTTPQGRFEILGAPTGTYTITPSKDGFAFDPPAMNFALVNGDINDVNFAAISLFHPPTQLAVPIVTAERVRINRKRKKTRLPFTIGSLTSGDLTVEVTVYRGRRVVDRSRTRRIRQGTYQGYQERPTSKIRSADKFCTVPFTMAQVKGARTCAKISRR